MNASRQAPLGHFYQVEGRRLLLHRAGAEGPAVVFLPGASAVGLDYLNIHDHICEFTTSVLYDRGGTGWSSPADLPRTAAQVAVELRQVLRAARLPAPYLLVAHSIGGAYARRYAQLFPDEVAGLVYLDAFYENWDAYLPERLHLKPLTEPSNLQLRLTRLLAQGYYRRMFAQWPRDVRQPLIAHHLDLTWLRAGARERSNQP